MCFYWSTATIMLIGTSGNTVIESIFCNIILFFTVGIFAYLLENVAQTIKSITRDSMEYKINLETLNKYMRNNKLDSDSQVIVRQQLEQVYKSSQQINLNKQSAEVLQKLPENLRSKIRNQINKSLIKKFQVLTNIFSHKIIEKTYLNPQILQEIQYVSQQNIFNENDPVQDQIYIYLVLGGEVQLYYTKKNNLKDEDLNHQVHIVKTFKVGQVFGIKQFFTGQMPKYSAKATQFTNIVRIKRSGFINLLKYDKLEYEKFCQIKDQMIQRGKTNYIVLKCNICNSPSHCENECSLLNYNPKRYQLSLKDRFQKTFQQTRVRYYRYNEFIYLKQINSLIYTEINKILNNHFNLKYSDISNINRMFYKNYIQNQEQMEYQSDSSELDSSESQSNFQEINPNQNISQVNSQRSIQAQLKNHHQKSGSLSSLSSITEIEQIQKYKPLSTIEKRKKSQPKLKQLKIQKREMIQEFLNSINEAKIDQNKQLNLQKKQKQQNLHQNIQDGQYNLQDIQQKQVQENILQQKRQSLIQIFQNNPIQIENKKLSFTLKQPQIKSPTLKGRKSICLQEQKYYPRNFLNQEDLFVLTFDNLFEYEIYFPKQNMSNILKKYITIYQNKGNQNFNNELGASYQNGIKNTIRIRNKTTQYKCKKNGFKNLSNSKN